MAKTSLRVAPKARSQKVSEIYLAVSARGKGEEVYTVDGPNGEKLPLVALDAGDADTLRQYVERDTHRGGKKVEIIRFTGRTLYDSVAGLSTGD